MDSIKGDPSMALGGASTVAKVPFIKCIDKGPDHLGPRWGDLGRFLGST